MQRKAARLIGWTFFAVGFFLCLWSGKGGWPPRIVPLAVGAAALTVAAILLNYHSWPKRR